MIKEVDKSLLPKYRDMITQSILLEESYHMHGTKAKIIFSTYDIAEIGYEPEIITFDDKPLVTYILLDDSPKPKLLKQLGWITESDDSTKPLLATIPRYLSRVNEDGIKPSDYFEIHINKYTKVYLYYDYSDDPRIFQVTEVSSNSFNPIFYYLKLVPYREKVTEDPSPINDPNTDRLDKADQFRHLTFTPRGDTKYIY